MVVKEHISVEEVADLLKKIIRVRSVGRDETKVAEIIIEVLEREGIETYRLIESARGRGNLIIDINGKRGEGYNLMIVGHSDVVPVEGKWSVDPWGGVERNGYIYGRGAIDDKGQVAAMVYLAILLHRLNNDFRGKVRLLIAADEEIQDPNHGVRFLVRNHPEIFKDIDGAIGELGGKIVFMGEEKQLVIFGEKGALSLKVRIYGDRGHASNVYGVKNAVEGLARLLTRLPKEKFFISKPVKEMFSNLMGLKKIFLTNRLLNKISIALMKRKDLRTTRMLHAITHITIAKTVLRAGQAENVYPEYAEAILDIRYFPENYEKQLLDFVRKHIPSSYKYELTTLRNTPSTYSSLSTRLYATIEKTIHDLGLKPLPLIQTGTSDSAWIRKLGIPVYNFMYTEQPLEVERIHGNDERIRKEELINIIEGYYRLIMNLQRL